MNWLRKIIDKIFNKNKVKLLEEPKKIEDKPNTFILELRQTANLEVDDGNGYGIIKRKSLKEMV